MPYQPGLGWLLQLCPFAVWMILATEAVILVIALKLMLKPTSHPLDGESKILLLFFAAMVLVPVGFLVGIGCWFAVDSILCGVGATLSVVSLAIAKARC